MSIITVASFIQAVPFVIVALLTGIAFYRQREIRTLYLAAVFVSISTGLLLLGVAVIFGVQQNEKPLSVLVQIGDIFAVIAVFAFLLFVLDFHRVSQWVLAPSAFHFIIALALIAYSQFDYISTAVGTVIHRSTALLVVEYSFLAIWLIFSCLVLLHRSLSLSGLMRGRMRFIVFAGFLATVAVGLQYFAADIVELASQIMLIGTLLCFISGLVFFLGFNTPGWLRRQLMSSQLDRLTLATRSLAAGVKLEDLLQTLVRDAVELLGVNAGMIGLWVQKRNEMVIEAVAGLDSLQTGTKIDPKESFVVRKILSGQPAVLADATRETTLMEPLQRSAAGSLVGVPIILRGQLIGGLVVFFDKGPFLTSDDVDFLTLFANHAAIAIHDASLYVEVEKRAAELKTRAEELAALNTLATEVSRSLDLDQVLAYGVQMAVKILKLDAGGVYLANEKEGKLSLVMQWNLPPQLAEAVKVVGVNSSFIGEAALSGKLVTVSNIGEEERSKGILLNNGFYALACAPLKVKNSTLGVLALTGTEPHAFSSGEIELLTSVASQISIAVENARLYESTDRELQAKVSELTAYKAMLESTIQSVTHGLLIYDVDNRLVFANKVVHRFFGKEEGSLVGLSANEVARTVRHCFADPTQSDKVRDTVLAGPRETAQDMLELVTPQHVFIERTVTPILSESSEFLGQVVVYRDATEEKESQRMKDEFLATISHELRTPLTAILGYTDLMLRKIHGDLSKEQEEFQVSVRNNALRLLALINDLLDLTRIGAGKLTVIGRPTSLEPVLARATERVTMLARAKKIKIEKDLPLDLPHVLADQDKLQQIFENLVSNAVKFTENEGTIWINAQVLEKDTSNPDLKGLPPSLLISIKDTGVGIPQEHLDRIWDAFHQAESSSSRRFGGMGLGLSITKNLVELHGGKIWAKSEGVSGKGSTFYFTIPLANTEPDNLAELAPINIRAQTAQALERKNPETPQ